MTAARLIGLLVMACMGMFIAKRAEAACRINSTGLVINTLTTNTGTYTPPITPLPLSVSFTLSGTYDTNNSAGTCTVGLSWYRATLPASMARSGGGTTLSYQITSASGGGNSFMHTGGGPPALANIMQASFTSAGPNLNDRAFTVNMTAYFQQLPTSPQRAGSYSDSTTLRFYNIRTNGRRDLLASSTYTITGGVALACTIGGLSTGSPGSALIPVSSAGVVNTLPIARSFGSVVCNSVTAVQTQSLNGAVRRTGTAPSGFTNIIDYTAQATFGGVTSTLNTATIGTANGTETGTSATTAGTSPTGTLAVTITPLSTSSRLMAGTYNDTLRITLTPQ